MFHIFGHVKTYSMQILGCHSDVSENCGKYFESFLRWRTSRTLSPLGNLHFKVFLHHTGQHNNLVFWWLLVHLRNLCIPSMLNCKGCIPSDESMSTCQNKKTNFPCLGWGCFPSFCEMFLSNDQIVFLHWGYIDEDVIQIKYYTRYSCKNSDHYFLETAWSCV